MKVYVVARSETVTTEGFCKVFTDGYTAERYMTGLMIEEIEKELSVDKFIEVLSKEIEEVKKSWFQGYEGRMSDIIHHIYEEYTGRYIEIFEDEVC